MVFDFFAGDALDDGIYEEVDMSEAGSATDINFTVKKAAGIYEISFIYAQDPQKAKNSVKRPSPDTVAMDLRSGFARKLRLLSWSEHTPM